MQKTTNLLQNLAKNLFFKFAPKCWSNVLLPDLTGLLINSLFPLRSFIGPSLFSQSQEAETSDEVIDVYLTL